MAGATANNSTLYPLIPRRPAVPLVLLFITGILLHPHLPSAPGVWLLMMGLLVSSAVVNRARACLASSCLALAALIAAVALAQLHATRFSDGEIAAYVADTPRLAEVELRVDDPPRILSREYDIRPVPPRQVFTATVTTVREWGGWTPATGRILVQIDQPHPRLRAGQTLRVLGMIQRPGNAMNPGQFDWARYYREQRILSSLRVRSPANVQILARGRAGLLTVLRQSARSSLALGFTRHQSLDHALLRALLLGDNDPEFRDVQAQFIRTGTSHHLAISGMHIAVLGGFVFCICRLLAVPPRLNTIIVTAFVALYGAVTLPSPPVLRSVALCLFVGIGLLNRRSLDMLQMLALSALAMLIYNPLDLFNAGFQLSFVVVLGLVVLTRPMIRILRPHDPDLAPLPRQHRSSWQAVRAWMTSRGVQVFAAALVAWAVSLPLVAIHFERLNPWAMFASIALALPVFAALILGLLKIVLTLLFPSGAGLWASLCIWPITLMREMVDWLATFPGSDLAFPRPTLAMVLLYYALLCVPLLGNHARLNIWRLARLAPAGACLLLMCLPLLLGARAHPVPGSLRLTVLAIGAGSCAVLELPDRRTFVFDAGSLTLTNPVERCIGPFLRHRGINRIDALFLSHANYDHFGAAVEMIDTYRIRHVYLPPQFSRDSTGNPPAERLMRRLARDDCITQVLAAGESVILGDATRIDVLWPTADMSLRLNETSLVLRLTCGRRSILLPGDIQALAQRRLLDAGTDLRADLLIAPHHGSFESTTGEFIYAVAPSAIVSSNDRTLSLRQMDFEEILNMPIYRTHRHGAVAIDIADDVLTIMPFRDRHPGHSCPPACAGAH